MKKLFTTIMMASILLSLTSGCKKNSDSADGYYLKLKIDGNWVTWTNALAELGKDLDDETKTNFGFQATSPDTKQSFGIAFQVDGASISTGTYSSDDYYMPVDYIISNGGSTVWYSDKYGGDAPFSVYNVTLNNITETSIRGSFTGNFLEDDMNEENTIAITEGEFYLKRIR